MSILLPSLNKAKELAKSAACLGQLRGIGTGFMMYAAEHDAVLPPPVLRKTQSVSSGPYSRWGHDPDADTEADAAKCAPLYADALVDAELLEPGCFTCVALGDPRGWESAPVIGYQFNDWFTPAGVPGYSDWGGVPHSSFYVITGRTEDPITIPLHVIDYPQEGMLIADGPGENDIWADSYVLAFLITQRFWTAPSRHGDQQNALMFDGHAEARQDYDFWPYLRYGEYNTYYRSKFWWPVEVDYGDRSSYLDW